MEAPPRLELGLEDLESFVLPLHHRAPSERDYSPLFMNRTPSIFKKMSTEEDPYLKTFEEDLKKDKASYQVYSEIIGSPDLSPG